MPKEKNWHSIEWAMASNLCKSFPNDWLDGSLTGAACCLLFCYLSQDAAGERPCPPTTFQPVATTTNVQASRHIESMSVTLSCDGSDSLAIIVFVHPLSSITHE